VPGLRCADLARYPAVEALTALLFIAVTWHDGWSFALGFDSCVWHRDSGTDLSSTPEHMILPNAITYPGILFALITRAVVPYLAGPGHFDDLPQLMTLLPAGVSALGRFNNGAALGALVGGGSLWLMGFLWEKLRGVEAMGLGDVKMMLMVGAYLGWRLTILTILIGALSGSLIGVSLMVRRGSRDLQMMLPFRNFPGHRITRLIIGRHANSSNGTHRNFARVILSVRMAPLTVTGIS